MCGYILLSWRSLSLDFRLFVWPVTLPHWWVHKILSAPNLFSFLVSERSLVSYLLAHTYSFSLCVMCGYIYIYEFSSIAQSCLMLCKPVDCSMPGFPVQHQLLELTQTQVHWISDTNQPFYPLSSPSLSAFNLSQHQGLFQWVAFLHQVAKVLKSQLQHQSFQWTFRTDFL